MDTKGSSGRMTCFQKLCDVYAKIVHRDEVGIWLLDATTMTASRFRRSEVAIWQLHAATLTATHWVLPIGEEKNRKQMYGYGWIPWSFRKRPAPGDAFRRACMNDPKRPCS